jgi:predicted metal-binding protein
MLKNSCFKCGAKKATKFGEPKNRGVDSVQRVRCDKCGQMRMNVIKPRKKKESNNGPNSDNQSSDN